MSISEDDRLRHEKPAAEKWGKLFDLVVFVAINSALNGWLLSICASFFFPSFLLTFPQWWLLAFTFRALTGHNSADK